MFLVHDDEAILKGDDNDSAGYQYIDDIVIVAEDATTIPHMMLVVSLPMTMHTQY